MHTSLIQNECQAKSSLRQERGQEMWSVPVLCFIHAESNNHNRSMMVAVDIP